MKRKRSDAVRDFLEGTLHFADLRRSEREYLDQLKLIEAMWSDGKTDRAVRNALCEKFHLHDNSARKLLGECMLVFGDIREVNRKMQRYRAEQMAIKAYELAEIAGDYKAMIAATKAFAEANGLNNDDPDLPEFANLDPGVIVTVLPDGMEEMVRQLAATGGVIDHTKLPEELELPDLPPEPVTIDITPHESES